MNKEAIRLLNILKTNEELKKKIEEKYKSAYLKNSICENLQATFIDLMYFLGSDYLIGGYGSIFYIYNDGEIEHQDINIDNTKELLEQDETVLKQLNERLVKEFNINL